MLKFSFDASGFNKKLDEVDRIVTDALLQALVVAGEALRADSVAIVPFDHGFSGGLAGSSSTERPVNESGGKLLSVVVGYNKAYAAKLHEDLSLNINQRWAAGAPRQQKYLEKPMKENAEKYGTILRDAFNAALA